MIHDWIGAAFIPGTSVEHTLALIQDYDNHKSIYAPDVIASKLISHQGNDFQIYLRLLKKKIITVVLDTDHEVQYQSLDRQRWTCRSRTTMRPSSYVLIRRLNARCSLQDTSAAVVERISRLASNGPLFQHRTRKE